MRNLYAVLEVAPSASAQELRSAYRRLARVHHPDQRGGDAERFKELAAAYEVPSDPERRAAYDTQRAAWLRAQGAFLCLGCGHGIRVPAGWHGAGRCGWCKTGFESPPAGLGSAEAPAAEPTEPGPPPLMAALAERLRQHGARVGNRMLLEVARAAEQVPDEVAAELTARAVAFVRSGIDGLRQRVRAARDV